MCHARMCAVDVRVTPPQASKRKAADAEASLAGLAGSLQQQLAALAAEVHTLSWINLCHTVNLFAMLHSACSFACGIARS